MSLKIFFIGFLIWEKKIIGNWKLKKGDLCVRIKTIKMKKKLPQRIESLLLKLLTLSKKFYGRRLVTLAVFGSWAAGTNSAESDIDILVIAEDLSKKRLARVREFEEIEDALEEDFRKLARERIRSYFSPIFKTPEEVDHGSLLFLDMLCDLSILYDKDYFFTNYLKGFKKRLDKLGAKRIVRGDRWYWILKPDYRRGETFEI